MDKVIKLIYDEFYKLNIFWAIGASKLLSYYNITETVNDLDIIVDYEDIDKAIEVLNKIGKSIYIPIKKEYLTDNFNKFMIGSTEIDVMSNFKIKYDDKIYKFIFDKNYPLKFIKSMGVLIPLCNLEDWYIAYMLMDGREEKVSMIENYFIEQGKLDVLLFKNFLDQTLPESIINHIDFTLEKIKK